MRNVLDFAFSLSRGATRLLRVEMHDVCICFFATRRALRPLPPHHHHRSRPSVRLLSWCFIYLFEGGRLSSFVVTTTAFFLFIYASRVPHFLSV